GESKKFQAERKKFQARRKKISRPDFPQIYHQRHLKRQQFRKTAFYAKKIRYLCALKIKHTIYNI
ncbi:MAG: hypothetical protein ACOCNS_08315, partial [Bacteroidales bacterium]